jgi:hypothetical protein
MSANMWTQSALETAIEIALNAPDGELLESLEDNYAGLSQWIQDRTVEFEEENAHTEWGLSVDFYTCVSDWVTTWVVKKRLERA